MPIIQTLLAQFGIIVAAVITAFTIIKLNRDYQQAENERTRVKAVELSAGRTAIVSLEESITNLKKERERIIADFQKQIDEMEVKMEKLEAHIREGNQDAIRECQEMRSQMHSFIQDTWKLFLNK